MSKVEAWFIGNRQPVEGLARALASGSRSGAHAFLFFGPEEVGKRSIALAFARTLLGQQGEPGESEGDFAHPDFLAVGIVNDEGKRSFIGIEQARAVRSFLSSTPFSAERKVVLIDGAEYFSVEAANALLKTLEEPPDESVLFLIAHETARVLPTIRSRTLPVRFTPVPDEELRSGLTVRGYSRDAVDEAVTLADGKPGRALRFLGDAAALATFRRRREAVLKLLSASRLERFAFVARAAKTDSTALRLLPQWWMPVLRNIIATGVSEKRLRAVLMLRGLFEADRLLSTTNANPELILETALMNGASSSTLNPQS
ncbi:MAG: hypothetical protein HY475_00545 [Candidatus Terrybacteria bacterium]|nr:hypothetical protein [Candidatus Terrybacteria bacterium]